MNDDVVDGEMMNNTHINCLEHCGKTSFVENLWSVHEI
jgi:ribosomal protein L37E